MEQKQTPLSEDRVKGSLGIGVGLLLVIVLTNFIYPRVSLAAYWLMLAPVTAIFVSGCTFYSKSKGYSPYLGALGFLWIFGLVPLILLPDKRDNFMKELQAELDARRKNREANSAEPK